MPEAKKRRMPAPRGGDFLISWSRGAWAEEKVREAINATRVLAAVPYGASRGDPMTYNQMKEFWLTYQDRQGAFGKRPDLLVFKVDLLTEEERQMLPLLIDMDDKSSRPVVDSAVVAIEVETSVWRVRKYRTATGKDLSFTVKDEDLEPLKTWVAEHRKPLYIAQVFHDTAWMVSFDTVLARISGGSVRAEVNYRTGKATYSVPLSTGMEMGPLQEPTVEGKLLEEDNGRVTPYIDYKGGGLTLSEQVLATWLSK
jgi:hypothetical protein